MTVEQTLDQLSRLKLHGMKHALEHQLNNSNTYIESSFEERLGFLVDEEVLYKENRRFDRLLKQAKLRYSDACLEKIDYQHPRQLSRQKMAELSSNHWIRESCNIILVGPTGCGKSFIACALAHRACQQGFSCRFLRMSRLLEKLRHAHVDGSYLDLIQSFKKIDLIILDDFCLKKLSFEEAHDLLEIIEDRAGVQSIIMTTQVPIRHWHEYFGDPTIADAVLDRLLHKHYEMTLKGESMRAKTMSKSGTNNAEIKDEPRKQK